MTRLKISKHDDNHILLEAISGIDNFGFGTFLCNIQPDEVEADEFSKNALINASEQDGLNGVEIWNDNRIAWGSSSPSIIMPVSEISNMSNKGGWLTEIKTKI
jgi:hypothetical protein